MADETTTTDSGTNWGSLATILAGLIGGLSSGQSLLGTPNKQVPNTGPLTPEGQQIMDEYTKALNATPVMSNFRFGGTNFSIPNRNRLNVLKQMLALEQIRKGNLTNQPADTGLLGKLAPILASLSGGTKKKQNPNDPYNLGLGGGNGDSGITGSNQTYPDKINVGEGGDPNYVSWD